MQEMNGSKVSGEEARFLDGKDDRVIRLPPGIPMINPLSSISLLSWSMHSRLPVKRMGDI